MMAARFRSVTWVAIALVPALGSYLVTQYVAAERAELARVERRIGQSRKAIRDLETELGTRGSMAQIERWNAQTLALAAPTAQQFISGDVRLASLTALPSLPRPAIAVAPATAVVADVRQASFTPAPAASAPTPAPTKAAAPVEKAAAPRAEVRQVAFRPAPKRAAAEPEAEPQPLLRQTNYMRPPRDQARAAPTKVAMLSAGPLDARALADIGRIATAERGSRRP
ncbi:hypothetical protein [Sphingomonas profundi]|uniref:hypothetical protein n=1 Tax=Alterirhizorhabdus profundi TaxID=2681549 RepID=UPI0018D1C662|nr:hypothetical protein [Sphingomonas profundi]